MLQSKHDMLVVCNEDAPDDYGNRVAPVLSDSGKGFSLFSFSLRGRHIRTLSAPEHEATIKLPVSESVVHSGLVLVYLNEAGFHTALPFTFQRRNLTMLIEPSYETGKLYIRFLGKLLMDPGDRFYFKALILEPVTLKKFPGIMYEDYDNVTNLLSLIRD